jgi:hypothetical protein
MEVSGAGMDAAGPQRLVETPGAPSSNLSTPAIRGEVSRADSIATLLSELSQSNLAQLLEMVDAPLRDSDLAGANDLWRAASDAIATQNGGRALELLRQFAQLSPGRAENLPFAPEFAAIRSEVEQLLAQWTAAAKSYAEGRLTEALQKLEMSPAQQTARGEVSPEVLLVVAGKLLEAGGLANYTRSAAVSAALLDPSRWVPAPIEDRAEDATPSAGWDLNWRLTMPVYIGCGVAAMALCWYLRDDYLPIVCGLWAAGLGLLLVIRHARR